MKLFELFENSALTGADNLTKIAEAVRNKTSARIKLGSETVVLEYTSAKYVHSLYENSLEGGYNEQFMNELSAPASTARTVMENDNTMRHIVSKYKHEVKNFLAGDDLDNDLYHALFDYYSDHGEMPYGVAKGRDGDPFEWVTMRFDQDVHDYAGGGNPDIPKLPAGTLPVAKSFESLGEGKKVKEGWEEMKAMVAANAEKEKKEKGTGKFDKKTTSTGTVYSRKYDPKSGETEDTGKDGSGEEKEKRGRGRPRTRPEPDADAPKRGRGRPRTRPAADTTAPKRGRGRPKKVREWIETLRFISEGTR